MQKAAQTDGVEDETAEPQTCYAFRFRAYWFVLAQTEGEDTPITGLLQKGAVMADRVGRLVAEIYEDEVLRGRPMLSAVVVEKNTGARQRFLQTCAGPGAIRWSEQIGKRTVLKQGKAETLRVVEMKQASSS